MISGAEIKENEIKEEFHFPGGGDYQPMAVRAANRAEAEQIWLRERRKVDK